MAKLNIPVITILLLAMLTCFLSPCLSCPDDQKLALLEYKSLNLKVCNLSSSSFLNSWNSNSDCCSWDRVTCNLTSSSSISIQKLNLSATHSVCHEYLDTKILTPIFGIQTLQWLDVSRNLISGEIPAAGLTNLTGLFHLDMARNYFNDSIIPKEIFRLKRLEYLDLSENRLTGTIPKEIGKLTKLKYLSLARNQITGGIPHGLFNLKGLKEIHLRNNLLTEKIPDEIGNLLERLELQNNKLVGEIPVSLFNSSAALKALHLGGNQLTWNNKAIIKPNCTLEELSLRSCGLAGEIPEWISSQTSLTFLDLSDNRLQGILPISLAKIKYLNLSNNMLNGSLPSHIFQSSLTVLVLSMNNFTGELPVDMGNDATRIWYLALNGNNFVGPIPKSISKCVALFFLDLSENKLSGNIPVQIGNLIGMIITPASLDTLSQPVEDVIEFIDIFDLPVVKVYWKKSAKGIKGQNLDMYALLDLSSNQLTGEVPSTLGNLKGLKLLNLSSNNLSGTIPTNFGNLENVESLDLAHNDLSGSIPESLTKLQQLKVLDVSNNHLTGKIPVGGQMGTMTNPDYYANNSGLCGMQIRKPCPEDVSPQQQPEEQELSEKSISFFLPAAGIGYSVGLMVSVVVIYYTSSHNVQTQV